MDIRQALTLHIEAAISLPDCRVHRVRALPGTPPPYATIAGISRVEDWAHTGPSGLVQRRVQIDVYATTQTEALTTAGEIRAALESHRLAVMGGGVYVAVCMLDDESDGWENDADLYRVTHDYLIMYEG